MFLFAFHKHLDPKLHGLGLSAADCLIKPIDREILLAHVRRDNSEFQKGNSATLTAFWAKHASVYADSLLLN